MRRAIRWRNECAGGGTLAVSKERCDSSHQLTSNTVAWLLRIFRFFAHDLGMVRHVRAFLKGIRRNGH